MTENQRPRFNQDTGERIIYADEVNQAPVQSAATVQPTAPIQQAAPTQQTVEGKTASKSGCSGCLKGCLITFIVFVIAAGLLIGGGFVVYKLIQPKDVEFDEKDVESFYDKVGIDNINYLPSVEELLLGEGLPSGEIKINESFTSAEITAVIQDASDSNDLFENVNVRFVGEDQVEVFATVSDNIDNLYDIIPDLETYDSVIDKIKGKQLYYIGEVIYDKENGFQLNVDKLKVGLFKLPADMINEYDQEVEELLNSTIINIGGFEVDSMKINEDSLDFVGSVPEILE